MIAATEKRPWSQPSRGLVSEKSVGESVEWYTPSWIFDRLGLVFDLDPCSPPGGVPWIPARRFVDRSEDGRLVDWNGSIWLNPPYGREGIPFLRKMLAHRRGVVLIFARTDTRIWQKLAASADVVAFVADRIHFVRADGFQSRPAAPSSLIAFGDEEASAVEAARFGWTVRQ